MTRIEALENTIKKYKSMGEKCEQNLKELVQKLVDERDSLKRQVAELTANQANTEKEKIRFETELKEKDKMLNYLKEQSHKQQESSSMVNHMIEMAKIRAVTIGPSSSVRTPNQGGQLLELNPSQAQLSQRNPPVDAEDVEVEQVEDESNHGNGANDVAIDAADDDVEFVNTSNQDSPAIHGIFGC